MDHQQIVQKITEMVNDPGMEQLSNAELSGLLMKVLENNYGDLSDLTVTALFVVAAHLMRDHVEVVEKDILHVRSLMRPPGH